MRLTGDLYAGVLPAHLLPVGVFPVFLALAAVMVLQAPAAAGSADGKRPHVRHRHGYGFLPGYDPPEVIEWRRQFERRPTYWYGGPQFYHGRWNGGGFGPCWTQTPIGAHWNCG